MHIGLETVNMKRKKNNFLSVYGLRSYKKTEHKTTKIWT